MKTDKTTHIHARTHVCTQVHARIHKIFKNILKILIQHYKSIKNKLIFNKFKDNLHSLNKTKKIYILR